MHASSTPLALGALALALSFGAPAAANAPAPHEAPPPPDTPVALAEVVSHVAPTSLADPAGLLRDDVSQALAALDWGKKPKQKYLVSASLVRLDGVPSERGRTASCTVSATLRTAKGGSVVAILEGRARAEDGPTSGSRAERDALAAAAKSTVRAVKDAVLRLE